LSGNKVAIDNNQDFMIVLEKYIAANHIKMADRMVRKKRRDQTIVSKGQIMLFEFPKKLRTSLETLTLPERVIKLSASSISISLFSPANIANIYKPLLFIFNMK
jgi:hypothetical protein